MEAKGWLERVRDLPDRRAIRLQLTDSGSAKLDEILPITYKAVVSIFSSFSNEQLGGMSETFEAVYAAAAAQPGMGLPPVFEREPTADVALA
jgi:DNA-binding MarR family transcriptional regulator